MPAPDRTRFLFAERPGGAVLDAALAWLRGRSRPVFLWLHLYDPHAPYEPPPEYRRLDPYDGEVAFVDGLLGRLAEALQGRGRPVLLAVTSDHGEAFGEHGEWTHGVFLYQTTLHVPLILDLPGAGPQGRIEARPAQSLDLLPSMLDALGLRPPAGLPGRSLLRPAAEGAGFLLESLVPLLDYGWHELYGLRTARWKQVRAPRPELYDLHADPGETRNLHGTGPELDAALGRLLQERGRGPVAPEPAAGPPLDPEQAAALAALGYASAGAAPPEASAARPDPKDRLPALEALGRAGREPPERAIEILKSLLEREPDNKLARQRLGWLLYFTGRLDSAAAEFERFVQAAAADAAVQRGAVPVESVLALADCQARTGRPDAAIATMQRFEARVDRPAYLLLNLGLHLRRAGREAEAKEALRRGLEFEPELLELRQALGLP
jgi:tetratricopeptide (TPR) repeat protein